MAQTPAEHTPPRANRLAREKSPYLLQHASNPVDWYPWGPEAFERARREDKPVLLSIGYSTCHWCHVMAEESFENPAVAELMNRHFVSVKVDREERPDVDQIYMRYVIASTGGGGWPMTVFLSPDGVPFYGGTYFPPEDRFGRPGFPTVLGHIANVWKAEKAKILENQGRVVEFLQAKPAAPARLSEETLHAAFESYRGAFDEPNGGFGTAPKFPSSHNLSFLLRFYRRRSEPIALAIVEKTLEAMARGGLYDRLGGGFHRYSTDALWRVPHFEKMLYDQAMLLRTYVEAWQATGKDLYRRVARETADYVLRDLGSPEGAFYSAEDADSPDPDDPSRKREGAFYVWTLGELERALGPEDARRAAAFYGAEEEGNAIFDPQGELQGRNVLYDAGPGAADGASAEKIRRALLEARSRRPRPHRDDKVLTDWNGLMIGSLALAGAVLEEPRYVEAARAAAAFAAERLEGPGGRLLHRWRDGEAGIPGQLDDYAFLIQGLLDLYEATFETAWLEKARALALDMLERFADEKNGGFFMTARDAGELLIARPKEGYDGALPSGNSVAALDLVRLGRITGDPRFEKAAGDLFGAFSEDLASNPAAHAQLLIAFDFFLGPSAEVVIAAGSPSEAAELIREVRGRFVPNKVVLFHPVGPAGAALRRIAPFTAGQGPVGGRPAAYVCRDRVCRLPVTEPGKLRSLLEEAPKNSP
jgi:hypothetical protein